VFFKMENFNVNDIKLLVLLSGYLTDILMSRTSILQCVLTVIVHCVQSFRYMMFRYTRRACIKKMLPVITVTITENFTNRN
jgi:hypothetical protein